MAVRALEPAMEDDLVALRQWLRDRSAPQSILHFDVVDAGGTVVGVVTDVLPQVAAVRPNWHTASAWLVPLRGLTIDIETATVSLPAEMHLDPRPARPTSVVGKRSP